MMDDSMKQVIDTISVATAVGTVAALLPPLAALFTIIWTAIRIWETETVQRMLRKKPQRDVKGRFLPKDKK
tara:strand:- start:1369 stop:1581 length:213 start_codon:yes stop_codon:yes gene_type:complete